jgi:imidazolonepropionase-like amidohydrolase
MENDKKAFIGGKIYTISNGIIENGIILIQQGKIVDIGENLSTEGYQEIDASNRWLTPGLIDAHSHVGLFEEATEIGVQDGNEFSSPLTPGVKAVDAIFPNDLAFRDAKMAGVTTLGVTPGSANLIGGEMAAIKTSGILVDDMIIKDFVGVKFALGENPSRIGTTLKRAPYTRMANAFMLREIFQKAKDYLSEWEHYEAELRLNQSKPQEDQKPIKKPKTDLELEVIVKLLKREIPARFHAHRADDIATAIRLSEEIGFDVIIEHTTEGHLISEFLAKKNPPVVCGPLLTARAKRELAERTPKTPGVLMKAGVDIVCITTDAPVIPIQYLRDSVIVAVREGLPKERAIETITINPAKILGIDDRVGSLQKGYDADIVLFDGDPLDSASNVVSTYINGKEVFSRE